jgi:hypothetical protein
MVRLTPRRLAKTAIGPDTITKNEEGGKVSAGGLPFRDSWLSNQRSLYV